MHRGVFLVPQPWRFSSPTSDISRLSQVVLANEFSDSSSEDESDADNAAAPDVGNSSSSSSRDLERAPPQQLSADKATAASATSSEQPSRHQPSLFFTVTPRRPQQPRSRLNGQRSSERGAAVAVTSPESSPGEIDTGDRIAAATASVATVGAGEQRPRHTGVVAAPVRGQGGRVGWMIDPAPTPRPTPAPTVDPSLSERTRKSNKSGWRRGGRGGRAAAASAGVRGDGFDAPDDNLREGAMPSASAWPDETESAADSTGGAADDEGAGISGGGGDGSGGGSTPVETCTRDGRGNLEYAKPRRRLPPDTAVGSGGSSREMGRQAQERSEKEPFKVKSDDRGMAPGQPNVSREKLTSGGGGEAGSKRSSPVQGPEEKFQKVKNKQKKRKKTGGPNPSKPGGKKSSGGRNAIDAIFGSLL